MNPSTKSPLSHRFYRVVFDGFNPLSESKLRGFFYLLFDFVLDLYKYISSKLHDFVKVLYRLTLLFVIVPKFSKDYIVRKLIWSRGKLGKTVAPTVVLTFCFFVFLLGKVFSASSFVNAREIPSDYVSYVSDIIPQRYIATTDIPENRKRNEPFTYTVEVGDTVFGIGTKFKISKDALLYVNNLTDDSILKIGQQLQIPPVSGLIHKVGTGDNLASIAAKYDVAPQAIADFNYILDVSRLAVGTELVIPGASIPERVIPTVPAFTPVNSGGNLAQAQPSKSFCVWPSTVRIVTQYFTWYHNGIDVATPWGKAMPPLFACTGGVVTRAGWDPWGLGLHVRIDHGNGYETVYGHMSRLDVGYGEQVNRGQIIGLMGSTGNSTGPHVHFIVKYNGVVQNPLGYTQ